MSTWAATRRRIVDNVKYTMEDYTLWPPSRVVEWVVASSDGSQILTKYLPQNSECFAEADGRVLAQATDTDLQDLGVNYHSRALFLQCMQDLRANEEPNKARRAKAARLKQAFLESDVDGSGTIDFEEIRGVVRQVFPETTDSVMIVYFNVLLRECDPERTGVLALTALQQGDHNVIMMKVMQEAEQAEIIEARFNEVDADGSGQLDLAEMRVLIDRCFPDTGPTERRKNFNVIVREIDKNNDGTITLDEFLGSPHLSLLMQLPPGGASLTKTRPSTQTRCAPQSPRRREPLTAALTGRSGPVFEVHGSHDGVSGETLMEKAEELLDQHQDWCVAETCFLSAANAYVVEGNLTKACAAFQRCSDCQLKLLRWHEAIPTLQSAIECAKQIGDTETAANCTLEVADLQLQQGRRLQAAQQYRLVADLYQQTEPERSVDWYMKAVETYQGEWKEAQKCLHQVFTLYVRLEMFAEARQTCEQICTLVKENATGSFARRTTTVEAVLAEYGFYGLLCRLAEVDVSNGVLRVDQLKGTRAAYDASIFEKGPDTNLFGRVLAAFEKNDEVYAIQAMNAYCEGKQPAVLPFLSTLFRSLQANIHAYIDKISVRDAPVPQW